MRPLTPKQQKFVDAWDGSAKTTAKASGYTYGAARQLLLKEHVQLAIANRNQEDRKPTIANRQDRQQFWTDVMHDSEESMTNRLRAAELLGKSEADFTDNIKHSGGATVSIIRKRYDGKTDDVPSN